MTSGLFILFLSPSLFALPTERVEVVKERTWVDDIYLVDGWGALPANETVADFFAGLKRREVHLCDVKRLQARTGQTEQSSPVMMIYEIKNCSPLK